MSDKRVDDWIRIGRFWLNTRTHQVMPVIQGGALPATDAFTTASDQALTAYSSNWTYNQGTFTVLAATDDVKSITSQTETAAHWNADSFNNDQYSQGTKRGMTGNCIGVAVRCHASSATWYGFYTDGLDSWLYKNNGATWTQLSTSGTDVADGDTLRIEASGTTLTARLNGSTSGAPAAQSDSSIASGYAGICGYDNSTPRIDDWEGGNLSTGATVNLGTITLAGSVPAGDAIPGAVTKTLATLTLAGSVPASDAVPGAVTGILSTLTLASSIPAASAIPGAVSLVLAALSLAGSIPAAIISTPGGSINITLTTISLAGSIPIASASSPAPGANVTLSSLSLAGSVPAAAGVNPGAVSVWLDTLDLQGSLPASSVSITGAPQMVTLDTLTLQALIAAISAGGRRREELAWLYRARKRR